MRIAYLANSFPESTEPYVWEEIAELRRHSVEVVPCSAKHPQRPPGNTPAATAGTLYILPLRPALALRVAVCCIRHWPAIRDLVARILLGPEPVPRKLRALVHTWLGVCLALRLRHHRPGHIHVHHGYFAAWVGMVAARILGFTFSMTLHGSDLLVRADYLETKLRNCSFCCTVSEFNRRHILRHYPEIHPSQVVVRRMGIDPTAWNRTLALSDAATLSSASRRIVNVGRLHPVKNQGFLLLACRALKDAGVNFQCLIAGEGPERTRLQELIAFFALDNEVKLLGHVPREQLPALYEQADAVVLTSASEGIPITLMEAMAMERTVIAPDITGIAELVIPGKTGLLYRPNSLESLLLQLQLAFSEDPSLHSMQRAARQHVLDRFNSPENVKRFVQQLLTRLQPAVRLDNPASMEVTHADSFLQQIQFRVQRN